MSEFYCRSCGLYKKHDALGGTNSAKKPICKSCLEKLKKNMQESEAAKLRRHRKTQKMYKFEAMAKKIINEQNQG